MKEPVRIISSKIPSVIENLGNGYWYYNFNIVPCKIYKEQSEANKAPLEEDGYNFIQIKLKDKPTYKNCVEAVIREYVTQSEEFDLINSYNRATFNLLSDEEAEDVGTKYVSYLDKVAEIKSMVGKDFE